MTPTQSVAEFAARARAWLADNMPSVDPMSPPAAPRDQERSWQRARELQKRLYEGGFAGICFPREYGGQGLPYEYQRAFDEESLCYEMPLILNTPTFTICCATLLDTASEEQKKTHIGAALRGDEVLVQLLSEPSGGSDLAGVLTRAVRRGDRWVIDGAKTWSTSAFAADYGLCLARTDWDVPKHEGLTMFLVPIDHPGITLRRITQVNGSSEFCEEFLDGVDVGEDAVVGEVNNGWPWPRDSSITSAGRSGWARSSPVAVAARAVTRRRSTTPSSRGRPAGPTVIGYRRRPVGRWCTARWPSS